LRYKIQGQALFNKCREERGGEVDFCAAKALTSLQVRAEPAVLS